ncbi:hypothetical protein ASC82_06965 [Streptomyces sp. Root431]|uniref:hypothetical protein n=1 Tax=Streptomyces TaxID=1883 RepID=UPI0006FFE1DB|nr:MULTISPECIES: hypothetical protein [unclassified Streptomyces]KQX13680.1 hypothetical protein ASC82_06965 [Streptomyces sp. Root431]
MKSTKVAAVVAGSLVALGAATPAMAAAEALTPTSLNGGLEAIAANGLKTDMLSTTTEGSPLNTATDALGQLNEAGKGGSALLGGLPLGG